MSILVNSKSLLYSLMFLVIARPLFSLSLFDTVFNLILLLFISESSGAYELTGVFADADFNSKYSSLFAFSRRIG